MATNNWTPDTERLTDADAIEAEWKRGLAAKGSMELLEWEASAVKLREAAALLRDALVPVAAVRERLSTLVDEMSKHLPERRTARRVE